MYIYYIPELSFNIAYGIVTDIYVKQTLPVLHSFITLVATTGTDTAHVVTGATFQTVVTNSLTAVTISTIGTCYKIRIMVTLEQVHVENTTETTYH